jgi:uncharacterized membrane protein (DUF4010 family)
VLAAVSGTFDVDAISLSMARLAPSGLDAASAAYAILIAVAANSVSKVVLAATAGGGKLGLLQTWALGAALVAAALGVWITQLM